MIWRRAPLRFPARSASASRTVTGPAGTVRGTRSVSTRSPGRMRTAGNAPSSPRCPPRMRTARCERQASRFSSGMARSSLRLAPRSNGTPVHRRVMEAVASITRAARGGRRAVVSDRGPGGSASIL
jgi:hypothetical protein